MRPIFMLLLVAITLPACASSNSSAEPVSATDALRFLLEHVPRPEASACGAKAPSWVADEGFAAGAGTVTVTVRWDAACPPPEEPDKLDNEDGPPEPALLKPEG